MKNKLVILFAICLLVCCTFVACNTSENLDGNKDAAALLDKNSNSAIGSTEKRTPLDVPQNLATDGLEITWNPVANAFKYELEYFSSEVDVPQITRVTLETTSYSFNPSEPGWYAVRVRALGNPQSYWGKSIWTDWLDFRTAKEFQLATPTNVSNQDNVFSWDAVEEASAYKVMVDDQVVTTTKETGYRIPNPIPGHTYSVSVLAVGDIYYLDSEWTSPVSFTYEVEFDAPQNIKINNSGTVTWNAVPNLYDGYLVAYKSISDVDYTEVLVKGEKFDVTTLAGGGYYLKVRANGGSEDYHGPYSSEVKFSIDVAYAWDGQQIADQFVSWNFCTAKAVTENGKTYASFLCREGWGGMVTPVPLTIDYGRNPVFVVDYKQVPFGYMGNFHLGNNLYTYAPDIKNITNEENFTRAFLMTKQNNNLGNIAEATGIRSDVLISIGFTHAPTGTDSREVMQLWGARIVYVEEFPEAPETPQQLDAPQNATIDGYHLTWDAISGNSIYTPRYNVEVYANGQLVHTQQDVKKATFDLREIDGGLKYDTTYSCKVQAVGDGVYFASSTFASSNDVVFAAPSAPTNVRYNNNGFIVWNSSELEGTTYTVNAFGSAGEFNFVVSEPKFDITQLPSGDYTIKVKTNGSSAEFDSPYSQSVDLRVTVAYSWDAQGLVNDFASWNICTAHLVGSGADAYASLTCGEGWGGISLKNAISINYDKNPILVIDYKNIPFGYMGNYGFGSTLIPYIGDTAGQTSDLVRYFAMNRSYNNTQNVSQASGVVNNFTFSIGFTLAPGASSTREVMQLRSARIVYVEEIAEIPNEPVKLGAPSNLAYEGTTISWKGVQGNSEYTPEYVLEIYADDGNGWKLAQTLDGYQYTKFDLRNATGFSYNNKYKFTVKAKGDNLYFASSESVESKVATYKLVQVDLMDFALNSIKGGPGDVAPSASYSGGKLILTKDNSYGMRRYAISEAVDVQNSYLVIDIDSITGGSYFIRVTTSNVTDPQEGSIISHDSNSTGTFIRKLTTVTDLSRLTGEHSLALYFGLSGTNMTCTISSIAIVTVNVA